MEIGVENLSTVGMENLLIVEDEGMENLSSF